MLSIVGVLVKEATDGAGIHRAPSADAGLGGVAS